MIPSISRFNSAQEILLHHLNTWFNTDVIQYGINIVIAAMLGWLIGFNHTKPRINIGSRTFSAVAIGSCLAAGCILHISHVYQQLSILNSVPGILSGVGFIAGAVIIKSQGEGVFGLTSAATIWATAVVGLAVGLEFYAIATLAAVLLAVFLWITRHVDE